MALAALGPVSADFLDLAGPSPVQRVIKLLNKMKSELEEERNADEKLYKDLQCWCKTNTKNQDAAIKEGKQKAKQLEADIKKYAGNAGEYKANMEIAAEAVKKAEKKMDDETTAHEASIEGLRNDETDLVATVNALENAMNILGKHQGLLQKQPALLQSVSTVIHFASEKSKIYNHPQPKQSFLQAEKSPKELSRALEENFSPLLSFDVSSRTLDQFFQTQSKAKQPSHLGPYESQSGGVFGVISQMHENFKEDLADNRNQIKEESAAFQKMKASLSEELKTQNKAFDDAKANMGKAQFYSTEGKEVLTKTREATAAATKVLSAVKSKCQSIDKDWGLRTKARAAESEAVDKAIEIMTSDENREALGFSFLQTRSRTSSQSKERAVRNEVATVLTGAANNISKSWSAFSTSDISILNSQALKKQRQQLMLAATAAKLDAFTKVKELIDKMVADIKQQMADDVASKDQCGKDIRENEQATRDALRTKELTESNIEGLQDNIEELKEQIAEAHEAVAAQKQAVLKSSEEREEENKNFQTELQAQRDMGTVLNKAYTVLKTHFDKAVKSLVQVKTAQPTDLPGEITPYKQNAGKNAVLAMFEKIIADTKTSEAEFLKEEAESQASYEQFVADANASIDSLNSDIASMEEDKAAKGKALSNEKTVLQDTDKEIENLGQMNGALHGQCDFLLKYFDLRQEAMSSEIAACQKAKAILSGAK